MSNVESLSPTREFEAWIEDDSLDSCVLRCGNKIQGIIKHYPNGKWLLEIRCKDSRCAERGAGVVVLHYFDLETGKLDHTDKFRDPRRPTKLVERQDK